MRNHKSITQGLRADFANLIANRNYLVLNVVFSLLMCTYVGFGVFLDQIFSPFFSSTAFIAAIASTFLLFGSVVSQLVGCYLDKTAKYLKTLRILAAGASLFMASSLLLFPTESQALAIGWAIMAGSSIVPAATLLFNFMTETTHPLAPALVINAAWMTGNLIIFAFNILGLLLLAHYKAEQAKGSIGVLFMMTMCAAAAFLVSFFVKEDLKRHGTEPTIQAKSVSSENKFIS